MDWTFLKQFDDRRVVGYIEAIVDIFRNEYHKPLDEICRTLNQASDILMQVFEDEPDIVLHDDPAKWAEIFAVRFGWAESREIEFA